MDKDIQMNIDPEMIEMFRSECKDNFEQAEDSLLALENNPENKELLNTLFRALHTLKGVSNMMGFEDMGRLAHAAEELAGIFRDEGVSVTQDGIDIILRTLDILKDMADVAVSEGTSPHIPDDEIISEIKGMCASLRQSNKPTEEVFSDNKDDNTLLDNQSSATDDDKEDLNDDSTEEVKDNMESENIDAFLFFIDEELPGVKKALEQAKESGNWDDVIQKSSILEYAASDLGFPNIKDLFSNFIAMLKQDNINPDTVIEFFARIEKDCLEIKEGGEKAKQEAQAKDESLDFATEMAEQSEDIVEPLVEKDASSLEDEFFEKDKWLEIDPDDLSAFLVFLEEEYPRLKQAMSKAAEEDNWELLSSAANMIEYAAKQLELDSLADTLNALKNLSHKKKDERTSQLVELEKNLVEAILALKQLGEKQGILAGPSEKDLSSLFVNRVITDAEAMNGRLKECADAIKDSLELIREGKDVEIDKRFFEQASEALRLLYHFSIFYDIDTASEAILILEDIYNRMSQGEISPDPKIPELTGELAQLMQDVFESIRDGRVLDSSGFKNLLTSAKTFTTMLPGNHVAGTTQEFINFLDISPGFYEVVTPESNAKIAEAFKKGLFFYEIRVDLDSNPEVASPFMELGDRLEFITNETLYKDDRTEYNFLVASKLTEDEIEKLLIEIFHDKDAFSIKRCKVKESIKSGVDGFMPSLDSDKKLIGIQHEFDETLLEKIGKCVEEVATVSSVVHYVVNVLEQLDYEELLGSLLAISNLNDYQAKHLKELITQLRNLIQTDKHLNTFLEELQNNISKLITVSSKEILEWLALVVRNISSATGVRAFVNIEDNGVRISRDINRELRIPLKRLIKIFFDEKYITNSKKNINLTLKVKQVGDSIVFNIGSDIKFKEDVNDIASKIVKDASINITAYDNGFLIKVVNSNAIVNGMVMQSDGINYIVPVRAIKRILEPSRDDITFSSCDNGYKILRMEDELVSVKPIFGDSEGSEDKKDLLVIVESQSGLIAYEVDEIIGQEQLRVVPLSGHLSSISGATGCAILGNGDVGIVLDVG